MAVYLSSGVMVNAPGWMVSGINIAPPLPSFESGRMDHPHTIDRWDDATGENLIEQIAAVGD
jgi:hypothetical protein